MAKPKIIYLIGREGHHSLEDFWAQTRLTDPAITARIFQLFGARGDRAGASESAAAVAGAADRNGTLRAPELAAIAIPGGVTGADAGSVGDSNLMIGLLFDMPWQLAFGLTAISVDTGLVANNEPRGWLEASLAVSALASPFYLETGADLVGSDIVGLVEALGPVRGAVSLSGDFSAGVSLSAPSFVVDWLALSAGNDFNLILGDSFVAAGQALVVDAGTLSAGEHIFFDGSGETDGRFHFTGSAGDDIFFGGAGADRIEGGPGRDSLSGGGGSDVFIYRSAADSSGAGYDTIADFNPVADRIDLPGAVGGFAAAITSGTLSAASFDADLAAAVGNLGATRAIWFAPNAGDLAGQVFLIADGNGQAGYQAGGDFVIAVIGSPLATLAATSDIFV